MSTYIKYDPTLFLLERATEVTAKLGELILGVSTLGAGADAWLEIPMATFTMSGGYTPDDNGTLIVDNITATIAISSWVDPGNALVPGDQVRASYNGAELYRGTVDSISLTSVAEPTNGHATRYDFTATLSGGAWIAMNRVVPVENPGELDIDRVRRYVTVAGFDD